MANSRMAGSRRCSFGSRLGVIIVLGAFSPWFASLGLAQRVATSNVEHIRGTQRITVDVENAPLATALSAIARQAGLMPAYDPRIVPVMKRVTLHLHEMPAAEAFEHALRGTGLVATVLPEGNVMIVRNTVATVASGTITGRVIAAATKQPLRGAKVGIDGTDRVTETEEDGSYRLSNIGVGSYMITVKLLGYARASRSVAVQDNATTTADITLELSATPLDQVVVTGTVVQTELKAVPNAITVITAKQIEERGITHIDQFFRGDIPSIFALNRGAMYANPLGEVLMFSRGATALSSRSVGTDDNARTSPIKTYIDGIEIADPKYLSQIDPKTIERIEILTGPQASTIYGSNAINGVMQIFTKRGTTSTPQLTLNLLSGWVENNFSAALTPQHDYSAQLTGLEGRFSYNAGGSWNYTGRWTPANQTTRTGAFSGMRFELPTSAGRVTADATFRRDFTQSSQHGNESKDTGDNGFHRPFSNVGLSAPTVYALVGQTLGLTVGYAPVGWWMHELTLGQDASDTEQRKTRRGYLSRSDTTLQWNQNHTIRQSLRYTTTMRIPLNAFAQATATLGGDNWHSLTSSLFASPQTLTGMLSGEADIFRQPSHNAGGFFQTQLGVLDRVFVTYGLRAEWNPDYGVEALPNYAPRYGISYVQEMGSLTAKVRGSYGRSTRPPQPQLKRAQTVTDLGNSSFVPYYGNFDYYLANPELTPEYQKGGEGGLELYFGTIGSLVVTRYNQTVDGLIDATIVDSVRTFLPNPAAPEACPGCGYTAYFTDANGYSYTPQFEYLNIGSIRNQGWELQGSVNTGPFVTKGTYSWTKSRVIGINPKYRWFFNAQDYPQYQPGATFQFLPEHTWSVGTTYAQGGSVVAFTVNGTGSLIGYIGTLYNKYYDGTIRLPQNRLNVTVPFDEIIFFEHPYAMTDLTASHRVSTRLEAVVDVHNLMNYYKSDYVADSPTMGRQMKVGIRYR